MNNYSQNKNKYIPIKEWRSDERPREKLISKGRAALTDSELIAIMLGAGVKGVSAIELGKELLEKYQSVARLASLDISELSSIKGIGKAKALTLISAFELGRRAAIIESFDEKTKFNSPEAFAAYFIPKLRDLNNEVFIAVMLNTSNQIIREVKVSEGILDACLAHPREIFKFAILENSSSVAIIHNHPSGNPEPSQEDILLTKQLKQAGDILNIKVIDHIIIAKNSYYSFAQRHRL